MSREKTPAELWMVVGGYGSGKTHIANCILESASCIPNIKSIDLDFSRHANDNNVFSLILYQVFAIPTELFIDANGIIRAKIIERVTPELLVEKLPLIGIAP